MLEEVYCYISASCYPSCFIRRRLLILRAHSARPPPCLSWCFQWPFGPLVVYGWGGCRYTFVSGLFAGPLARADCWRNLFLVSVVCPVCSACSPCRHHLWCLRSVPSHASGRLGHLVTLDRLFVPSFGSFYLCAYVANLCNSLTRLVFHQFKGL